MAIQEIITFLIPMFKRRRRRKFKRNFSLQEYDKFIQSIFIDFKNV